MEKSLGTADGDQGSVNSSRQLKLVFVNKNVLELRHAHYIVQWGNEPGRESDLPLAIWPYLGESDPKPCFSFPFWLPHLSCTQLLKALFLQLPAVYIKRKWVLWRGRFWKGKRRERSGTSVTLGIREVTRGEFGQSPREEGINQVSPHFPLFFFFFLLEA